MKAGPGCPVLRDIEDQALTFPLFAAFPASCFPLDSVLAPFALLPEHYVSVYMFTATPTLLSSIFPCLSPHSPHNELLWAGPWAFFQSASADRL